MAVWSTPTLSHNPRNFHSRLDVMLGCICHERCWIGDRGRGTNMQTIKPHLRSCWCLAKSLIHGTKMSLTASRRQMGAHHFGAFNSHDTVLPPATSLTHHWSLQGDCRKVGSIDTSSLHQCSLFPLVLTLTCAKHLYKSLPGNATKDARPHPDWAPPSYRLSLKSSPS